MRKFNEITVQIYFEKLQCTTLLFFERFCPQAAYLYYGVQFQRHIMYSKY